jgi:hypothetical protein
MRNLSAFCSYSVILERILIANSAIFWTSYPQTAVTIKKCNAYMPNHQDAISY